MNRRVRRQAPDKPQTSVVATLDDPRVSAVSAALSRLRPASVTDATDYFDDDAEAEVVLVETPEPEALVTPTWAIAMDGTLLPRAPLRRIGWRERAMDGMKSKRKRRRHS